MLRAGSALMAAVAARPGVTAGVTVFAIVFGTISANALWYQHGGHPAPLLRTRDASDPQLLVGFQRASEPENVVTYRIERPEPSGTADAEMQGDVAAAVRSAGHDLVFGVQQELVRLGYYRGTPDGVAGSRTAAAIAAYQKAAGLPANGEVTDTLLAVLKTVPSQPATVSAIAADRAVAPPAAPVEKKVQPSSAVVPAVVPAPRPSVQSLPAASVDPVAEAIRNTTRPSPPAAIPAPAVATGGTRAGANVSAISADAGLVAQIQRGLSRSYENISVDGVAGAATRDAIRNFERAYRLPETGEPNERVLKKLKDIGAI